MRPIPAQNVSPIGDELTAEIGRLVESCRRLWTTGVQHPHFTRHDLRHSAAILHQVGKWLTASTVRLNEYEVFVLVAAAYLHDVGMQCRSRALLGQIPELSRSTMPLTVRELQVLRAHHARLSYEMVRDACRIPGDRRYPEVGLDCTQYAPLYGAAALVCLGHVGPADAIPREVTEDYPFDREAINLLLVQHLLRVGDALDATQGRISHEYSAAAWSSLDARDKFHTLKHQYVASIDMDGVGVFRFNYAMPDCDKAHYRLIAAAAEAPLRAHVHEAAHTLRTLNVPVYEVRSRLLDFDAPTTYPLEPDVLDLFAAQQERREPRPPLPLRDTGRLGEGEFRRFCHQECSSPIDGDSRFNGLATGHWLYDGLLLPHLLAQGWVRFAAGFKAGVYGHPAIPWCIKILGMGLGADPGFFAGRGYYNDHERRMLEAFARHGFTFQPGVMSVDESIEFLIEQCGINPDQAQWQCRQSNVLIIDRVDGLPLARATGRILQCEAAIAVFDENVLEQCEQAACILKGQLDEANAAGLVHNDPVPANILFTCNEQNRVVARLVDLDLAQDLHERSPDYISSSVAEMYVRKAVPRNAETGEHIRNLDQHIMEQVLESLQRMRQWAASGSVVTGSIGYTFAGGMTMSFLAPAAKGVDLVGRRERRRDLERSPVEGTASWSATSGRCRERWVISLQATLDECEGQMDKMVHALRRLSGDAELTIRRVRSGSLIVEIDTTREGGALLERLFSQGDWRELLGYKVLSVKPGGTVEAPARSADVLVVVTTAVELHAVIAAAEQVMGRKQPCEVVHGSDRSYLGLGEIGGARVLVVQTEMGSGTVGGSQSTVSAAINEVHPRTILMVGICFGFGTSQPPIGEILISRMVQAYEAQRVGTGPNTQVIAIPRGERVTASPRVLSRLRTAAVREKGVRFGLLLSGEKLIDNCDYRDRLREAEPEAIGGDMEAAGLYTAVAEKGLDWAVVKAVCDYADGHKRECKEERQSIAAGNAARFVLLALKQGGFGAGASDSV